MLTTTGGSAGMSVDDAAAAIAFYRDALGLPVQEEEYGFRLTVGGSTVFVYPKGEAHEPATYTAIYLDVPDIDAAVDEVAAAGIALERYDGMPQDDRGVMRGLRSGDGPDIAWFLDPARNVIAIAQSAPG